MFKIVLPPENVLLIPKIVPAKFGAKSMQLPKWPLAKAPLKNIPEHRRTIEQVTLQRRSNGENASILFLIFNNKIKVLNVLVEHFADKISFHSKLRSWVLQANTSSIFTFTFAVLQLVQKWQLFVNYTVNNIPELQKYGSKDRYQTFFTDLF